MKYITNFLGVGCVALLAMLIMAPGAFAQQTVPRLVTNLDASPTSTTAGSITVSWDELTGAATGGVPITAYDVQYRDEDADPAIDWTDVSETIPTTATDGRISFNFSLSTNTVPGIQYGRELEFRVRGVNIIGDGGWATESGASHDVPAAPTEFTADARAVTETQTSATMIMLSWVPVTPGEDEPPITSYVVQFTETDPTSAEYDDWADATTVPGTIPTAANDGESITVHHEISGVTLEPATPSYGRELNYRVKAVSAALAHDASTEAGSEGNYASSSGTTHDAADPPTMVELEVENLDDSNTDRDIKVSWIPPTGSGTLPITGYLLEFSTSSDGGQTWSDWAEAISATANEDGSIPTTLTDDEARSTAASPPAEYLYRVRTLNAASSTAGGDPSDVVHVKLGPPGVPTGFKVEAVDGGDFIRVSWGDPEDNGEPSVTGFRVDTTRFDPDGSDFGTDGRVWGELALTSSDDPLSSIRIHRTPVPGQPNYYRVRASNDVGDGVYTEHKSATPSSVPDAPRGLTAKFTPDSDMSSITLSWDSPMDNNGSNISKFKIEISEDNGSSWPAEDAEDDDNDLIVEGPSSMFETTTAETEYEYVYDGVENGKSYLFRVSAFNDAGEGPSVETTEPVNTAAAVPAQITNLESELDATGIKLTWTVPDNGGQELNGYDIESTTGGTPTVMTISLGDVTLSGDDMDMAAYTHTGLEPDTEYTFRVRANNGVTRDASEDGYSGSTDALATHNVPGAPMGLEAMATEDVAGSITLTWEPPASNGGTPLLTGDGTDPDPTAGYIVEVLAVGGDPTNDTDWTRVEESDITVTAPDVDATPQETEFTAVHTLGESNHNVKRSYRVKAINGMGEGGASGVASATTHNLPGAPTELTAELSGEDDGANDIVLSWTEPANNGGSAITGYEIKVSEVGMDDRIITEVGTTTTHIEEDLSPGTTRSYQVRAVTAIGEGAYSNDADAGVPAVAPDPPTDLTAQMVTDGIKLSWLDPEDTGGADITGYQIQFAPSHDENNPGNTDWSDPLVITLDDITEETTTEEVTRITYTHNDATLSPGTMRYYQVSATNEADLTGDPSNVANAPISVVAPHAPTNLRAVSKGVDAIELTWTAPTNTGGSDITGYEIDISMDGVNWNEAEVTITAGSDGTVPTTYTHTGLTQGDKRHYRVSAVNSAGTGATSDPAHATTGTVTRYAVSSGGETAGDCTDLTTPCTMEAALEADGGTNGDIVRVRIRRKHETATIGDDITISKMVTLGVYVRGEGDKDEWEGSVSFTGSVKLSDGANLMTLKGASVYFDEIEIAGMSSIDKLVVKEDVTIDEDDPDNAMTSVLAVDELTVRAEQTLTIGEGANVRVRLTKGADKMIGKFEVKGTTDGGGDLWIAHTSDERSASGFMLHQPMDYVPDSKNKVTADDCLMITGGGTVENDLYLVAAGNVCVSLEDIGSLVAVGSIVEADVTTDVIFRNAVTVAGDIQQWNDARVLFEQSAMIEGDVTLDYGDAGVGAYFGTPDSDPDNFERAGNSGVEFAANSGEYSMSTVEGDLVIENGGGIYLQGAPGDPLDRDDNPKAHNLSVEGDVFAYADAEIMMEHPAKSTIEADLCSAPELRFGNRVMLSGDVVVFTNGATLTIPTVVIADDVEVEEGGTLIATTVHVTEDGELDSEGTVQVEDALILQGDGLEGSLAAGSTVNNLMYGTADSDEMDLGSVTRLSVSVGADRGVRFSDSFTVTNLGLCSGSLVLVDPDPDTDAKTMTVTDTLMVKDGFLSLDSSRPGSVDTDIPKENENRTADHSYILKYVTGGKRMADLEWFGGANAPRKVAVDHADAVIIVNEAKSLAEGVHLFKGHLHMKGEDSHLTIGPSGLYDANPAGGPFLVVDNAELHSNGNNVQVHGIVKVATGDKEVGAINTGGGELHVLGMTSSKNLDNASAVATVGGDGNDGGVGMIDVGAGVLQLGPETMNPKDGLHGDWQYPIAADARPHVKLDVNAKGSVMGMIRVPSGSKQTEVIGVNFGAIVFDGTKTPNKNTVNAGNPENWDGTLYVIDADKNVTVDSLGASNGAVEFRGTKATVNKDVAASSVAIYQELKTLDFKGDLAISGSGGFSSQGGAADNRHSVMIGGDYSQETTQKGGINMHDPMGGSYLSPNTDKTVMGSFMTSGEGHATRYSTQSGTSLTVKGDFDFGLTAAGYMLNADLEFSGKEAQTVGSAVDLGDVLVNNSAGLVLSDSVSQGASSMLTLTNGIISSDMYSTWTVKNPGIEEDLRGRNNALTTCDDHENCASVIAGGTRRSHVAFGVSRYVMKGNSGEGERSGGYVFPVGGMSGDRAHYRPLILQLEDDLSEAMPVTVTPMMGSDDAGDINIVVPLQGGSITLDAYADMFWKVEIKEAPDLNPNIRIAADGLANVFDGSRLRMVQWDCDWSNARLAGVEIIGTDDASFEEIGYVNGILNLTQHDVDVRTCAIFGVASNGIENPIHMDPLTGGIARIQFIHNLPLPFPVDLFLDGVKLMGGLNFQSATGYGHYAAGDHLITVNPVVPPGVVAPPIEIPLPSLVHEQNYAVIAHGSVANPSVKILSTKLRSSVDNMVEAILVHGSGDLGEVDVRILDPADNMTPTKMLANNFSFDSATRYISLAPGAHNVQVTSPDNRTEVEVYYLDLNGYQGEALILNLSGGMDDLGFMGVRNNGDVFLSQVVTGVEEEGGPEIPTEFALHGNYPNPFNPSTRIEFDLPESAQVSLQIVDMLGRQVMTLPAQQVEAGANRTLELNATNLASGHYLYRIIATGVDSRYVKTGRMTLVK